MFNKKKAPPPRKEGKRGEEIAKITIAFADGKTKEFETPSFVLVSVNDKHVEGAVHITGHIFNSLIMSKQLAETKKKIDASVEKEIEKDASGFIAFIKKAIEEADAPDPFPEFSGVGGDDNT